MALSVWLGTAFSSRVSCNSQVLPISPGARAEAVWVGSSGSGTQSEGGPLTRTSSWKVISGHLSKSSGRSSRRAGRFAPTKEKKLLAPWRGGGHILRPWEDANGGGSWGWGRETDRGHFLEGVEQNVVFVTVLGFQLLLGDDRAIHFSVLGAGGGGSRHGPSPVVKPPLALCAPSGSPGFPHTHLRHPLDLDLKGKHRGIVVDVQHGHEHPQLGHLGGQGEGQPSPHGSPPEGYSGGPPLIPGAGYITRPSPLLRGVPDKE